MRNFTWKSQGSVLLALGMVAGTLVFVTWLSRRSNVSNEARPVSIPYPAFSASSHLNTAPGVAFVGIAACKECHSANYNSYLHTAHSRALVDLDPVVEPPDGTFDHPLSGRSYQVYRDGKQMHHVELMKTADGQEIARLDIPIRYLVGTGTFSRNYLVEQEGFLTESPISWYTQKKKWAISPGFDLPEHPGFTRPVADRCLVCHTGHVAPKGANTYRLDIFEKPIGCESCHGPGGNHAEFRRRGQKPSGADDFTIVNPGKLPRDRADSICAQCHLQGQAAIIHVRGRKEGDFRPGMPLSDYRIDYRFESPGDQMRLVGHVEQLRHSACYQKSEMSCLTCHDPHLGKKPADMLVYQRQKCLTCHTSQSCTLDLAERTKPETRDNCTICHMPRGQTDIPHIALTHHRIGKHSKNPQPESNELLNVVAVDDAPHLSELDRKRNQGLAFLEASTHAQQPAHAKIYHRRGWELLESVYEAGLRDGATVEGIAMAHWQLRDKARAVAYAREALAAKDLPTDGYLHALQVLIEDHLELGEPQDALELVKKLTEVRRFSEDWGALGACYLDLNQPDQARDAFNQALAIDPFRPKLHAGFAEAQRRLGNTAAAQAHEQKAKWLKERSHR